LRPLIEQERDVDISQKTITLNTLPAHYLEAGAGNERTMLLLHGGVGDAELHWKEVMLPLAESFHVIAPDLPGYGGTAVLPEMSMSALVEWLFALFNALNLEQAVVIGNSIGAVPARLFASAHSANTSGLILINGGALPHAPAWLPALARIPGIEQLLFFFFGRMVTSRRSLERMIYVKSVLTDEFVKHVQTNTPNGARLMRGMLVYPLPEERTPHVPTLLLWGSNDEMTPIEDAEALKKDIPGAKLSPIADCGAMPQLEATDVFVYQVNYFLDHLGSPPKSNLPGVGMLTPR
jgi:pimeloyl-ACP methyl ester carboxylesterase